MGNAYRLLNQPDHALALYEQARKIALEIGDRHGEADALTNMGNAFGDLGQTEQGIDHKEEALAIAARWAIAGLRPMSWVV